MSSRPAAFAALLGALAAAGGCRRGRDTCGDPVAAAQAFVEAMEDADTATAFRLLSRAARERLEQDAREASTKLGQKVDARELLVPERSVLPRADWLALRSAAGGEAWVEVRIPAGRSAPADAPWSSQRLVREGGCWRVDLFHPVGAGVADRRTPLRMPGAPHDGRPRPRGFGRCDRTAEREGG
jgi:hypothetical protein